MDASVAEVDLAWTKRLLERASDPAFAERLRGDPGAAAAEAGLPWPPQRVRALWDPRAEPRPDPPDPLVTAWRERTREQLALRGRIREEGALRDPVLDAWRQRQIQRCEGELGRAKAEAIVHGPFAVELSLGCSVGCWFCGLEAGPLEATWPYTPENAETWRGLLAVLGDELGPAARWGICYWATEPLDNPDYERFLDDFHACLGTIPQTTTAVALRDPRRTRQIVSRAREATPVSTRFSVLSTGTLCRIPETFSPEELLHAELIPQFSGGRVNKAFSGRPRGSRRDRAAREGLPVDHEEQASTIACITGFLVRPLARTVQLVSPCRACDRWPKGYIVFGERTFADPDTFRRALHDLRDTCLRTSVEGLPRVRPGRTWEIAPSDDGLVAATSYLQVHLRAPRRVPAVHAMAALLKDGSHPADTVATLLVYTCGQAEEQTLADLDLLFRRGVLDEEP